MPCEVIKPIFFKKGLSDVVYILNTKKMRIGQGYEFIIYNPVDYKFIFNISKHLKNKNKLGL